MVPIEGAEGSRTPDLLDSGDSLNKTVNNLHRQMALDLRRVGATIALERSMQTRVGKIHKPETGKIGSAPPPSLDLSSLPPLAMPKIALSAREELPKSPSQLPSARAREQDHLQFSQRDVHERVEEIIDAQRMDNRKLKGDEDPELTQNLRSAFETIAASFDMDGDGTLDPEEVIHILQRCQMIDEVLTAGKVRDFFRMWSVGCNHILGESLTEEDIADGISFEEFETVLRWGADMKGAEFSRCTARVIRLSRKLCDGKSSDRRKLKTVFEAYCKKMPDKMTAFEFANLCEKIGLYKRGVFASGDAYSIFYTACPEGPGVDFEGFMSLISDAGRIMGRSDAEAASAFASGVSKLEVDQNAIRRVKLRIKHAANNASTEGWRQFFKSCDPDQSGNMDWDEFFDMCRNRLKLDDRENHLKILFEKLDEDDSGELSIDELIEFIEK
mmetsp:Transcript_35804/g.64978  ORF Transcript_35804/g.64978 Transcript_35804/m.64978 type:complete len:443 (+) Transcript_35804:50-1378(+)|eukprot:CAMPEP_0197625904 /NCGR_PEP_ID=MMETSP1338-20131121/5125_1 /TAXON_ID=43686 ORGANISM="Pelagodinium beii, Strain RCC1491" /NCGR_SAMPLE_ID=MMETSP1338 /ASSEMBLY_ACC=CAM_ASM_000754 /LENGTH=442 /DNA_ID=CAMNT_0043196413 /DNA_START=45 /DNA_END=1373 /DNA_ORIENTATION=-